MQVPQIRELLKNREFILADNCLVINDNKYVDNWEHPKLTDYVRRHISKYLHQVLKHTYSLLSKGIHELKENDIDNFIKSVSEVILIQLDYEKELRKKRKKRQITFIN